MSLEKTKTFPFRIVRARPRVRLFCLPFAGAGAATFRTWGERFPDTIEVCPVEIPGRGVLRREPLLTQMSVLRDWIVREMQPLLDVPVAIFGHSMGARVGFAVARALGDKVGHFFASGSRAPDLPRGRDLARLSDDELLSEIVAMGGIPPEILAAPELLKMALPALRADFSVIESPLPSAKERLSCPLTVFAGTQDTGVPLADAKRWADFTTAAKSRFVELPHDHFYLGHAVDTLVQEIVKDLSGTAC